jgi:cell division protein ZapA
MAQAIVTIAGRTFRLGCDEGQEKRLEELARLVDGKIGAMRKNFGEIGDQRLVVMAALEIADESADARARVSGLEEQIANLQEEIAKAQRREAAIEARLAQAIGGAAGRLERLARDLTPSDADSEPLA